MNIHEHDILLGLKQRLLNILPLRDLILFGSRARGDAEPYSDMDVLVVIEGPVTPEHWDNVLECAWEVGFEAGIVVSPVLVSHDVWVNGPEQASLLAAAVRNEGIVV